MSAAVTTAVLGELCKELKLPTVLREHQAVARQCHDKDLGHDRFLQELLQREVISRRENVAHQRLRQARFPDVKTLDQLEWKSMQGLSKTKIQALATGQFITEGEDVVIIGPIGTGKTHLAIALGVEAARRRTRVAFIRVADLVRQLVEARDDRQLARLHKHYERIPLLILDELGFVPLDKVEAELLFNLLADRYERCSTVVTSNLSFGEWVQVFGNEKLTTALLDRLAHHAHVLTTKGKSYRTGKDRRKST